MSAFLNPSFWMRLPAARRLFWPMSETAREGHKGGYCYKVRGQGGNTASACSMLSHWRPWGGWAGRPPASRAGRAATALCCRWGAAIAIGSLTRGHEEGIAAVQLGVVVVGAALRGGDGGGALRAGRGARREAREERILGEKFCNHIPYYTSFPQSLPQNSLSPVRHHAGTSSSVTRVGMSVLEPPSTPAAMQSPTHGIVSTEEGLGPGDGCGASRSGAPLGQQRASGQAGRGGESLPEHSGRIFGRGGEVMEGWEGQGRTSVRLERR